MSDVPGVLSRRRLDNLVIDKRDPGRVLAVLDWELSTLGHPLADLAYSAMPYHLPQGIEALPSLAKPLPAGGQAALVLSLWNRCTHSISVD
jgi:aminoglycoside phosphotransferase (APT) family kinase protein